MHRLYSACGIVAVLVLLACSTPASGTTLPCDASRVLSPAHRLSRNTSGTEFAPGFVKRLRVTYYWSKGQLGAKAQILLKRGQALRAQRVSLRYLTCYSGRPYVLDSTRHIYMTWGSTRITRPRVVANKFRETGDGLRNIVQHGLWIDAKIGIDDEGRRASKRLLLRVRTP